MDGTQVPIQDAFQQWNAGGTEIHNPNVDPRQGNVCLGVWQRVAPRTFKLTHRIWAWDTHGGFQGTLHLEALTLGDGGSTFSGRSRSISTIRRERSSPRLAARRPASALPWATSRGVDSAQGLELAVRELQDPQESGAHDSA